MAIIKHISIKVSPLALLKYITGETKDEEVKFITGLNCSEEAESAYMEMGLCYQSFANEKFCGKRNDGGKQKIKMHHYIQSFSKGEITPEEAHRIAIKWAETVFGTEHQIVVATHTDKEHIHTHFAVNAYSLNGKHWIDNKATLKMCRDISDKIVREHNLSVIKNPSRNKNNSYGEWLARQNGTSWKAKLCDDIDRLILQDNVKDISDLIRELQNCGYEVTQHKYLSVKPAYLKNRKAVRTLRLGDGYGLEELQYRIENKDMEMPISEVAKYEGVQRDYALCLRSLQIKLYRRETDWHKVTYGELRKNAELLNYVCSNNIHSKDEFENMVNTAAEKADRLAKDIKDIEKKVCILERYDNGCDELIQYKLQLDDLRKKYEKAVSEKKEISGNYKIFVRQLESDYEVILRKAKTELEAYEEELHKPPKREFTDVVRDMSAWAERVIATERKYKKVEAEKNIIQPRKYDRQEGR
ncbi:MAG: relaxase/mobilization nuclease domain-containing protein [Oscillospiraceae bacterium]|nr:relaxase/mobilization nuclease domain-containing protein [Oscillospiraceae bacterium]